MAEEKKKSSKVYVIVFVVFVFLLAAFYYFVFYKKEEAQAPVVEEAREETSEQNSNTEEINTSNWLTYENEEYGFSLKYPEGWEKNEDYSIWETENKEVDLLKEWGVNKGQESIFIISVYSKEQKDSVFDYYNYIDTGENVDLNNGLLAKKMDGGSANSEIFIENDKYVYVISSTFMFFDNIPEQKEYSDVAESLSIKN